MYFVILDYHNNDIIFYLIISHANHLVRATTIYDE